MAWATRKVKVINCWRYLEDEPPIPSIRIRVRGVKGSLESDFRVDTGYPGQLLISTDLYEKLGLYLAELPEKEFGVYRTASGLVEVKRSQALVTIPGLEADVETLVETPRRILFKRNLVGRGLINKLRLLLDGAKGEDCVIEYE
ncbi:hypothetical protein J7L00_01825 [Candidatus Bathyarchaeota archaeon]|nr:hypothetical protein [Candidatus Bathyarchaeota archaeon]